MVQGLTQCLIRFMDERLVNVRKGLGMRGLNQCIMG